MSTFKDAVPQLSRLPSGHVYGNDGSGKFHFQPTSETSRLAERFERTVERLGDLHKLPVGAALILSLPIRNAICTPNGLASAIAALHTVYRCGDHIALDWKLAHGWRDRRFLDPLTVDLLTSLAGPHQCTTKDRNLARQLIQDAMAETDPRQVWRSFCACAAAWWSDPLPYLIWSHCAGVQPLQPLSRGTWARYHTKLPLMSPVALVETPTTPLQSAYFSAGGQSARYDCILQAIAIVNRARRKHKSRQAFSDTVLKGLSDLLHEARDAGRLQVLLVGFIVDLVVNGGIQGQLAISSLVGYLQQTLLRLFNALLDKDLNALEAEGWLAIYESVLRDDTAAEKQRNKISAALSAFHNFIAWLGVPPLPGGVIAPGVMHPPRAELVWPQVSGKPAAFFPTAGHTRRMLLINTA